MNNNLLDTSDFFLSEKVLKKIQILSVLLLISVVITGVFNLFNAYKLYQNYYEIPPEMPRKFRIQLSANIILSILYGVLLPIQAFFFYRFVSIYKENRLNRDFVGMHSLFRWLLKYTIVGVILFTLNAIWAIFNLFFTM